MKIGYARVSTTDQNNAGQIAELKKSGCERIYKEKSSGGRWDRPELQKMLEQFRKGDVLVVWKLDRLSRSLRDLPNVLEKLDSIGVGFVSLTESIDTTTPAGRMMLQMIGAFAEFERQMIRERTKSGLERAKSNGVALGRRKKLGNEQRESAIEMLRNGKTGNEIARIFGVHPATISRLRKQVEMEAV